MLSGWQLINLLFNQYLLPREELLELLILSSSYTLCLLSWCLSLSFCTCWTPCCCRLYCSHLSLSFSIISVMFYCAILESQSISLLKYQEHPARSNLSWINSGAPCGVFWGLFVCSDPLVLCLGLNYMQNSSYWFSGFIFLYSFTFLCHSRLDLRSQTVHFM